MRRPGANFNSHPPPYVANIHFRKTFRFVNTNSGQTTESAFTITAAKLGALLAVGKTVNATVIQMFESIKINYVECWQAPSSNNLLPKTISVTYAGVNLGAQGSDISRSDMSIGATRVAHVKAYPRRDSQAAQWQSTQTNVGTVTMFSIVCSFGAVIDVCLECVITPDSKTANNTVTLTTVAVGETYYLALDNPAGGTGSSANTLTPDPTLNTTTFARRLLATPEPSDPPPVVLEPPPERSLADHLNDPLPFDSSTISRAAIRHKIDLLKQLLTECPSA